MDRGCPITGRRKHAPTRGRRRESGNVRAGREACAAVDGVRFERARRRHGIFDLGATLSAVIGVVTVLLVVGFFARRLGGLRASLTVARPSARCPSRDGPGRDAIARRVRSVATGYATADVRRGRTTTTCVPRLLDRERGETMAEDERKLTYPAAREKQQEFEQLVREEGDWEQAAEDAVHGKKPRTPREDAPAPSEH
jgi:hypothetical protein